MPKEGESPFFCLLEDDNLITSVTVKTDRRLEASVTKNEVVLLLFVKTRATKVMLGTIDLPT